MKTAKERKAALKNERQTDEERLRRANRTMVKLMREYSGSLDGTMLDPRRWNR